MTAQRPNSSCGTALSGDASTGLPKGSSAKRRSLKPSLPRSKASAAGKTAQKVERDVSSTEAKVAMDSRKAVVQVVLSVMVALVKAGILSTKVFTLQRFIKEYIIERNGVDDSVLLDIVTDDGFVDLLESMRKVKLLISEGDLNLKSAMFRYLPNGLSIRLGIPLTLAEAYVNGFSEGTSSTTTTLNRSTAAMPSAAVQATDKTTAQVSTDKTEPVVISPTNHNSPTNETTPDAPTAEPPAELTNSVQQSQYSIAPPLSPSPSQNGFVLLPDVYDDAEAIYYANHNIRGPSLSRNKRKWSDLYEFYKTL